MKICVVSQEDTLRPQGGTGTYARNISSILGARGHEVHVIVRHRGDAPVREQVDGVWIHRVPAPGPPVLYNPLYFRASSHLFWLLSKSGRFDVILGNLPLMSSWGLRGQDLPPVVETVHCTVQEELNQLALASIGKLNPNEVFARALAPIILHRERALLRRAARVISVSRGLQRELVEQHDFLAANVLIIPNGVDYGRFARRDMAAEAELRQTLGISRDDRMILYLGRLMERKRVIDLVRALPSVLQQVPKAQLVIVGRKNQNAKAIQMEAQRLGVAGLVRLVDHVPYAEVPVYFGAADVYCLPSAYEGFPFTVLEAMAAETPVVASKIKGVDEQITHGETGQMHVVGDIDGIASCIVRALRDGAFAQTSSAAAKRLVERDYDWNAIGDRTERVLQGEAA